MHFQAKNTLKSNCYYNQTGSNLITQLHWTKTRRPLLKKKIKKTILFYYKKKTNPPSDIIMPQDTDYYSL